MTPHPNMREAYGLALLELGRKNPHVVALEADLGKSTRSVLFQEAFPERYFQMGIAEQNMAATAAGLALAGKIPFIHSFAVFATGRAYDQLRNSICIPRLKVRVCGSSSGLSDFGDGKTHQSVEDVTLMRALPCMTVLSPVDGLETAKMMECLIDWPGPAYIRINRSDLPMLTPADEPYHIGKITCLRKGSDAALLATGVMVGRSLEAATLLAAKGHRGGRLQHQHAQAARCGGAHPGGGGRARDRGGRGAQPHRRPGLGRAGGPAGHPPPAGGIGGNRRLLRAERRLL